MKIKSVAFCGVLVTLFSSFYSCKKESFLSDKFEDELLYLDRSVEVASTVESLKSVPTRKAKQYTVTDLETGETKTFYDCREAGVSCDVGEIPPPPPPPNGKVVGFSISSSESLLKERDLRIKSLGGKTSIEIERELSSSKRYFENYLPLFYINEVRVGLEDSRLKFLAGDNFVAIVENNNTQTPLIVYNTHAVSSNDQRFYSDTTKKTKVAKINTETGVLECKEDGTNCAVGLLGFQGGSNSDIIDELERSFKGLKLTNRIFNGDMKMYSTKNYFKVASTSGTGEVYYLIK